MNKEEVFKIWAPDDSPWSTWVKPVLFAHLDAVNEASELPPPPDTLRWCPPPEKKGAMVADLPGVEGVLMGIALAEQGYRPVPLYNAVPLPGDRVILDPATGRNVAAVNVTPIISGLRTGTNNLARLQIREDAPPVFLLDANRQGDGHVVAVGEFDNRSVCFTTDFPSANFLLAQGIQSVLLVQRDRRDPQPDLAHVLRRWQEGGVPLESMRLDSELQPERLDVPRPPWFGAMFQRALSALGLRRSSGGGFGVWIGAGG